MELFDDTIESITLFDPLTGAIARKVPRFTVYPGTHYVTPRERLVGAVDQIREDLRVRLQELRDGGQAARGAAPRAAHACSTWR